MIKRDSRNNGKRVTILHGSYAGRTGIVRGFRGDWGRRTDGVVIPYVCVFVSGSIQPFRGDWLVEIQGDKSDGKS